MKKRVTLPACGVPLLLIAILTVLCSRIYYGRHRAVVDLHEPAPRTVAVRAGPTLIAYPDPAAPPEWDLYNRDSDKDPKDPTRAYWSLQIMAFKVNPLRKEAAAQAVRALRKQGVEAYYYHGETVSSVCVGAWPAGAVGHQFDRANAGVAAAPALNVLDAGMEEYIKRFPSHPVNYEVGQEKGADGKMHSDPSFLVVIPRPPGKRDASPL